MTSIGPGFNLRNYFDGIGNKLVPTAKKYLFTELVHVQNSSLYFVLSFVVKK